MNSYAKRLAAQEAAHRIAGVLDVANGIEVKLGGLFTGTDAEIARAVLHVFNGMPSYPMSASSSLSQMAGLRSRERRTGGLNGRDAERAVRRLRGVVGVINKDHHCAQGSEPEEVREEIEHARSPSRIPSLGLRNR